MNLELDALLGCVDENGVDSLTNEQVESLINHIKKCNDAMNMGDPIVPDAIYDRMVAILKHINPDADVLNAIWEDGGTDLTDDDAVFKSNPMYSIQTVKSFDCDELRDYVNRMPDGFVFDGHASVKLNGHGIRLVYEYGQFKKARSRARHSAGKDITPQLRVILERDGLTYIDDISGLSICEIRGEWVLPFDNMDKARSFNPDIKSPFSAVSSMGRESGTKEEWNLLHFVAYEMLSNESDSFSSKSEEYDYLESLGFEVPLAWEIPDLTKESLISDLKGIVSDCEADVVPDESTGFQGYAYYTDGIVFTINDKKTFRSFGDDGGHYKFGNIALKVGYWKQDMYCGFIQTIYWKAGKSKLSPVAIISEGENDVEFEDLCYHPYITSEKEVDNMSELGVLTAAGNRVRRVPLYEPANMVILDAYAGNLIYFRYGGEAGVVPCFEDGTPLVNGKIKNALLGDDEDDWVEYVDDYDE